VAKPASEKFASFALGLHVIGDTGVFPLATVGATLTGALLFRGFRFEIDATTLMPERIASPLRAGAGGALTFFAGGVSAGPRLTRGIFEAGVCVGVEVGQLRAAGFGVSNPGEASALWVGARSGITFAALVTPWIAFRLDLLAVVPTDRARWLIDEVGEIGRSDAVSARGKVGAEIRF
jgi:hypothetical protein